MRTSIRRKLAGLLGCSSGNATLIVALGMPVIIGAGGYGVDMAQLYMWKRELQHSVDQAALAGAWALAYDKDSENWSARAQQEFDANQGQTVEFDTTPVIELGSYDGGVNNSVIVTASAMKKLPFSSFLSDKPMYVRTSAQATYAEGATYKACLLALKKDASGTFTVGGNATVNASCGLGALSCSDDALTIDGSADVTTDTIVVCGTADIPSSLESKLTEDAKLTDGFAQLPPPEISAAEEQGKTFECPTGNKKNDTTYLSPGRYTGGWNVACKTVLAQGIYVIDGGTMDLTDNKGTLQGNGVLFVLRNGAKLKLGGNGNVNTDGTTNDGADIILSPLESSYFAGGVNDAYKDQYAGILFYEDKKDYSSGSDDAWEDLPDRATATDHIINGNAKIAMRGTLYLPNGNVTVNGNSSTNSLCFQLWAYTLKINGNTKLTTTCDSNQTNTAGTVAGRVRLVA